MRGRKSVTETARTYARVGTPFFAAVLASGVAQPVDGTNETVEWLGAPSTGEYQSFNIPYMTRAYPKKVTVYNLTGVTGSSRDEELAASNFSTMVEFHDAELDDVAHADPDAEYNDTLVSPIVSKDEALEALRRYRAVKDGWDGPNSFAPSKEKLDKAGTILSYWTNSSAELEPDINIDGNVALEVFSDEGMLRCSIEVVDDQTAVYCILDGTRVVESGSFSLDQVSGIISTVRKIEDELA